VAWSSASLSANEIAWAAADKPILSSNALYTTGIDMKWVVGKTSGTDADADESDDDYPAANMFDGQTGLPSKPDSASTLFTIVIDSSTNPIEFDWIGILNHNLDTLACSAFVVEIADDSAFTVRTDTLSTINVGTTLSSDRRFTDLSLGTDERFSDVPWIRIQITCSSGTPYIGEIVFGRRRQQPYNPDDPWDSLDQSGNVGDHVTVSGTITRQVFARGQRLMSAKFHHDTAALQSDIDNWWDNIEGAEQPFCYIDEPNSNPNDFWLMDLNDAILSYPYTSANVRELIVEATERGPHFFSQDP
jgi:hypothetical protein